MFRFTRSSALRNTVAFAAVAAVAGSSALAMSVTAEAAPTSTHTSTVSTAKRAADPGFRPVAMPKGAEGAMPLAVHSPAPNQTWVAARAADNGELLMLKLQGNRWSVHRGSVSVANATTATIDGDSPGEVWVSAGGSLLKYDGKRWRHAGMPNTVVQNVADIRGPGALVAWKGINDGPYGPLHIGTTTGNEKFKALDDTLGDRIPGATTAVYLDEVTGKKYAMLYAGWGKFTNTAIFSLVKGTWQQVGTADSGGYRGDDRIHAFLPEKSGFLLLGQQGRTAPRGGVATPKCATWQPKKNGSFSDTSACTTLGAVGAADRRSDGSVVIGGMDAPDYRMKADVPGNFRLRDGRGRERAVAGDVGEGAISMTVQPRTNTAWTVTTEGGANTLQHWDARR